MFIQNGKVIQDAGMGGIANVPSRHGGYGSKMWWNSTVLSPQEVDVEQPFEIRVVSTIGRTISRYVYTPSKESI